MSILGTALLSLTLLALASFVLFHNPHAIVNRRFAISAFAIAGWILCIPSALSASDLTYTVWLGRFGFAFASAIPFTLLRMFTSFMDDDQRRRLSSSFIPASSCTLFIFLSLSPWIVAGATPGYPKANFLYGPAHPLFGLYFLLSFVYALYIL